MEKKVKMTCILKSGVKILETIKVHKKDLTVVNEMIKEISHNGKYAVLYKSNDIADFADKTRQVLNDLEDYQLIAETVREECREIFCIDRHISGLRDIYLKVKKQ